LNVKPLPKHYLGIISELSSRPQQGMYNAVAVISGPEPQRTNFEEILTRQLSVLPGRYAIVCGKPDSTDSPHTVGNLDVFPFMSRAGLSDLLNETEITISRSGYTTLMDLAKTGHRAILCPTPGQYEQIYLADRLDELGQCVCCRQESLDIASAL